jgi:hypothetical protein
MILKLCFYRRLNPGKRHLYLFFIIFRTLGSRQGSPSNDGDVNKNGVGPQVLKDDPVGPIPQMQHLQHQHHLEHGFPAQVRKEDFKTKLYFNKIRIHNVTAFYIVIGYREKVITVFWNRIGR